MLSVELANVKKNGALGALGTVAASTDATAENGPHPTAFLARYINLCTLPLVTFCVTMYSVSMLFRLKPPMSEKLPDFPSSVTSW